MHIKVSEKVDLHKKLYSFLEHILQLARADDPHALLFVKPEHICRLHGLARVLLPVQIVHHLLAQPIRHLVEGRLTEFSSIIESGNFNRDKSEFLLGQYGFNRATDNHVKILLAIIPLLEYYIAALEEYELLTTAAIDQLLPDLLWILAEIFQLIQVFLDDVILYLPLPLPDALECGIIALYVLRNGCDLLFPEAFLIRLIILLINV